MIKIMAYYFWSDWTDTKKYVVDETKIHGIELHLRSGLSWHAVIVPRTGDPYEASHTLVEGEAAKLLHNPVITILKIVNYAHTDQFTSELGKLIKEPSQGGHDTVSKRYDCMAPIFAPSCKEPYSREKGCLSTKSCYYRVLSSKSPQATEESK